MNAIFKRRSIRKYTDEKVSEEKLFEFIKAGMNAPSALNEQPWQFVILTDRSMLKSIRTFHPYAHMLDEAPAAILVCGDLTLQLAEDYWIQDCSAATQNILLEIADQNYGAVWLGIYPLKERINGLKKLLNLPDHIIPFSLIALGKPAQNFLPNNHFLKERIHINKW